MRAWVVDRHGGPEVLRRKDVSDTAPGPGEARVRVRALGLNHLDVWVRKGVEGHKFPLPMIPGCDVAGEVESFGPLAESARHSTEERGIRKGARVLVNPILSCGACEDCLRGDPTVCRLFGLLGETRDGGAADSVVVPVGNLIAIPDRVSYEEAACLPIAYVTAWSMLTRKARVRAGQTVLVQAGGSGVSVAAIQIARLLGATVVTTVGSAEKARLASALGADHVINYREGDFKAELRKWLSSRGESGVDVAIDHVGEATFSQSLRALKWGGRLVTCGATTGSKVEIDLKPLFFKNLSVLGSTMGSKADLHRILRLVADGKLRAVVGRAMDIEELPAAMELLERREVFGKVVLRCSP